jgi:hypothetical protein
MRPVASQASAQTWLRRLQRTSSCTFCSPKAGVGATRAGGGTVEALVDAAQQRVSIKARRLWMRVDHFLNSLPLPSRSSGAGPGLLGGLRACGEGGEPIDRVRLVLEEPRASTTPDGRMVVRYSVEFELPDGRTQTVTAREEDHVPPAARVWPCPACASRAGTWPVPCACSTVSSTTATRAATTTRTSAAASPSSAPRRRALTGDCARTRRRPCGATATRTGSPHLEEPERGRTS